MDQTEADQAAGPGTARWRLAPLAGAVAIVLVSGGVAAGFGTINGLGQHAEHEAITKRALTCGGKPSDNGCFEPKTLDLLAGKTGEVGAIGYPDVSSNFFEPAAHCDNGDVAGSFEACRNWMKKHLDEAVADADKLVDASGGVIADQVKLSCVWAFNQQGKAKCNVLQDMGFVLHAAQDFYSHSNWTDSTITSGVIGLGNEGPSPYIGLAEFDAFPSELVSGCYIPGKSCPPGRVTHDELNKDKGSLPQSGPVGTGTTPRGKVHKNFERAVDAAQKDTRAKWTLLGQALIAKYGAQRGTQMICALSHDDPDKAC